MPRLSDAFLKSDEFKALLVEADIYSSETRLDRWATRIMWVAMKHGTLGARRFAQRRSHYQTSRAWACYRRLVDLFILSEFPEGVFWTEGIEPWDSDPMLWLNTIINVAAGASPPSDLPRGAPSAG